jgi:ferric-dicitrate binding protein FerR (iron transport regulator)
VLPDGSKVWLNAASSIRYPTAFAGNERRVEITGEAYFEVTKNPEKPFIVVTDQASVTVLGTHFNVMAYPEESSVQTTLLEGLVKVTGNNTQQTNIINPGQEVLVNRASGKIQVGKADTTSAVAWLRGQLSMENVDIQSLMRQVSRWYDVDVSFEGRMPDKKFFGMIDRNVFLSNILSVLEANGFQTKLSGNKIIVSVK